eukprot:gene11766-5104_t
MALFFGVASASLFLLSKLNSTEKQKDEIDFNALYQHKFSSEGFKVLQEFHESPEYKIIPNTINNPERSKSFTRNHNGMIRMAYQGYYKESKKLLSGVVYFGENVQGPPGCVHGGCIATLIDSMMGGVIWISGHRAVTVNLNVNYRKFIPLDSEVIFEVKLDKIEGRKLFVSAKLKSLNGEVLHNDASAIFLTMKKQ